MKKLLTLFTFLIGFGTVGWSQGGASTVLQIIQGSGEHTTLAAALEATGLDAALAGDGPLTVFAPTDAAFDALGPGVVDVLLEEPEGLLTEILLYHVVGAQALSTDLSNGQEIATLNGQSVTVTIDGGVFINDAEVIVPDLIADNGVVHVVNAVLLPGVSIWDIVQGSSVHTTLESAILAAELDGALSDMDASLTLFAPTDAAFDALPDGLLDDLLADPSGLLTQILLYHVVGAEAFSGDLTDGQMITTLNGQDIMVTIDGGVFINDAQVIIADVEADNGVVHVIDAVLVPAAETNTIWDIVQESNVHMTLEAAVLAAGLDGALSDESATLTLFAPTDAAFDALPDGLLDDLLADPSGLLTQILLYHVVGAEAFSGDLTDGQMITTLNGQDIMVTIDGGVFINDAQVIIADVEADNGVVHVIDAVLVPAPETCLDFLGGPYNNFNTIFGGAPVAEDGICPINQITGFEAWASEQYIVEGFQEGVEYTFSICEGPGAGSWEPELSVTDLDGNLIAFAEGCEITWTSPDDGDYLIGINEVGACGDESMNTETDNGFPTLTCTSTMVLTVWDIIQASPVHTTLEAAVLAAGLEGALSGDGPMTVFAPTDAAFNALPDGLLEELLDDPSGLLTEILLYHVVGAQALSTDLSNGQEITTLQGEDVTVTITGGNVFINNAQVIVADLLADNGVVHVIDAILIPGSVSVNEYERAQMEIFPNPATGFVNINLVNISANTSYQVFNIAGSVIKNGVVQPGLNTIDVQDFSTGLYLINIMDENNIITERLMIK